MLHFVVGEWCAFVREENDKGGRLELKKQEKLPPIGTSKQVQILHWTVALCRRDRKIPISALTQSTAETTDCCSECEWALKVRSDLPKTEYLRYRIV